MKTLSRRQLLVRGGLAAGAIGAASVGFTGPLGEVLAATPTPGFTAPRRRTYAALVAAVGNVDGNQVDPSRADWAADRFAAEYDTRFSEDQRSVDRLLDALAGGPGWAGAFAALPAGRRVGHLRRLEDGAGRDIAERALGLAALPFTPLPETEDDVIHPVPVSL